VSAPLFPVIDLSSRMRRAPADRGGARQRGTPAAAPASGRGMRRPGAQRSGQATLGAAAITAVARLQSEAISVAMLRRVCRGSRSAAERARRKFFRS
jgi:hypothetical protein